MPGESLPVQTSRGKRVKGENTARDVTAAVGTAQWAAGRGRPRLPRHGGSTLAVPGRRAAWRDGLRSWAARAVRAQPGYRRVTSRSNGREEWLGRLVVPECVSQRVGLPGRLRQSAKVRKKSARGPQHFNAAQRRSTA